MNMSLNIPKKSTKVSQKVLKMRWISPAKKPSQKCFFLPFRFVKIYIDVFEAHEPFGCCGVPFKMETGNLNPSPKLEKGVFCFSLAVGFSPLKKNNVGKMVFFLSEKAQKKEANLRKLVFF